MKHMKTKRTTYDFVLILFISFLLTNSSIAQSKNSSAVVKEIDLSSLNWKLWGYRADSWRKNFDYSRLSGDRAEYMNIPAKVPGSVQKTLKDAEIIFQVM